LAVGRVVLDDEPDDEPGEEPGLGLRVERVLA